MIARLFLSAWLALLPSLALAHGASAAPNDRARQWLTLVDDGNYAQSWKDSGSAFKKRTANDWAKAAKGMRNPLGAVANRALKSIDVSKPQIAVVRYDTAFARKAGAVETVTLSMENDGWVVTDYMVN